MAGRHIPEALHAVAVLGIADLLADGPKDSDQLAQQTGTHASSLYRVLRALAGAGVFAEDNSGRFRLTALGRPLRSEVADSVHGAAIMFGGERSARLDGLLVECLRSGKTAVELAFGDKVFFEQYQRDPEQAAIFNASMTALSNAHFSGVVEAYNFSSIRKLVDVGGGHGRLIAMILKAYPKIHGVLYDLPHASDGGRKAISEAGLAGRCEVISGDFFHSVPEEGDAYILSRVIHDWDDHEAVTILKVVRKAMKAHSRLLLFETLIRADNRPAYPLLSDLNMLLLTGGLERTEAEYRTLYEAAGFELSRAVNTLSPTGMTIIEGKLTRPRLTKKP
jgi:O-methyltransferase domain